MLRYFNRIPERDGWTDVQTDIIAISISRVSVLTHTSLTSYLATSSAAIADVIVAFCSNSIFRKSYEKARPKTEHNFFMIQILRWVLTPKRNTRVNYCPFTNFSFYGLNSDYCNCSYTDEVISVNNLFCRLFV